MWSLLNAKGLISMNSQWLHRSCVKFHFHGFLGLFTYQLFAHEEERNVFVMIFTAPINQFKSNAFLSQQ